MKNLSLFIMKNISIKLTCLLLILSGFLFFNSCRKLEKVMMVLTVQVKDVTSGSAKVDGKAIDLGEGTYISSGVCWATTHNPSVSGQNKTTDGSASGDYTSSISGLSPDADYYVRAYLSSSTGTVYGAEFSFRTKTLPAVTSTTPVSDAKNVPLNITISATFNQTMNSGSLNSSTFSIKAGSNTIGGSVGTSGTTVTISPLSNLTAGTVYTVTLTTGVFADGGVALPNNYTWSFTTVALPVSPSSLQSNPVSGSQINLSWTDNSDDEDGFKVERSPNGSSGWVEISTVGPNITTYSCTNLSATTTYYFRVSAYNSAGNSNYSNIPSATTLTLPVVSTPTISVITNTSAIVSGGANANGQSTTVTFEYGPSLDYGFSINASQGTVTGSVSTFLSASITGLIPGQTYHVMMKAISLAGTVTGTDFQFSTPERIMDINNNVYNTVRIGDAVWMAENLRTTMFNNGTPIPLVSDQTEWAALTSSGYCVYDNNPTANMSRFGGLYNYYSVTRNVCPVGWHVPSDTEWNAMITFLIAGNFGYGGSGSDIAKSMASTAGWPITSSAGAIGFDQSSNNTSGFTALPAGLRHSTGQYELINTDADFWSSTEYDALNAWHYSFSYTDTDIKRNSDFKRVGISVRCLKDN